VWRHPSRAWRALVAAASVVALGCSQDQQVLFGNGDGDAGPDPFPDAGAPGGASGTRLSAGHLHACAVRAEALVCWGDDRQGALGLGGIGEVDVPTVVDQTRRIAEVTAGIDFGCARTAAGTVRCFGDNARGQLGQGDREPRLEPARVPLAGDAVQVSGRHAFTLVRLADDQVACFGLNSEGQCALGDPRPDAGGQDVVSPPVRIPEIDGVTTVSAGSGHGCFLRGAGELWCWGRNTDAQLGLGPGALDQYRRPTRVGDRRDWAIVAAGQSHTCAVDQAGDLYCWGGDRQGQRGDGPGNEVALVDEPAPVPMDEPVVALDVSWFHTCVIDVRGALWCWGRNAEGQLGVGDIDRRTAPTRIGADEDWARVSTGRFFTCAEKDDATLWCSGANDVGQLGLGDRSRRRELTQLDPPDDPGR